MWLESEFSSVHPGCPQLHQVSLAAVTVARRVLLNSLPSLI